MFTLNNHPVYRPQWLQSLSVRIASSPPRVNNITRQATEVTQWREESQQSLDPWGAAGPAGDNINVNLGDKGMGRLQTNFSKENGSSSLFGSFILFVWNESNWIKTFWIEQNSIEKILWEIYLSLLRSKVTNLQTCNSERISTISAPICSIFLIEKLHSNLTNCG